MTRPSPLVLMINEGSSSIKFALFEALLPIPRRYEAMGVREAGCTSGRGGDAVVRARICTGLEFFWR